MNGDETTSFDYFGQLNQESKVALAFSEVEALIEAFKHHDGASPGSIPVAALKPLAKELGARYGNEKSFADVFGALKADTVSFSEFIQLFVTAHKQKKITKLEAGGAIHSFSEEEKQGYVDYINTSLQGDEGLAHVVPIDPHTMDIFKAVGDGVLLCKLINKGFPMTIDEAKLNIKSPNNWEKNENHDKCIAAAVKLGCSIVNIGGEDLIAGTPHLVMGLIWQIIKKSLLAKVAANLQSESEALDNLPPEQILFKWFNYHLTNAGHKGNVSNWSSDLKDGKKFIVLLSQLDKEKITGEDMESALSASSDLNRAGMVVEFAERIGCKEFVTPKTIVEGNPRLNLAFVATLFNKYPHMGPSPEELAKARVQELESELKETTESLASTKQQQHTLSEELTKLQKDFNSKDEQLQEVSRKLENILTERERLQQHVEELLDELATAKTRTEALQKDLSWPPTRETPSPNSCAMRRRREKQQTRRSSSWRRTSSELERRPRTLKTTSSERSRD
ncbi:phospholipid scramblase 1 [Balamuthia mandrillaris]